MTVIPLERRAVPATAGPSDLSADQVKTLFAPINPGRVQNLRGQSHLEAWDVRRWLNRVFGFGGWADETLELACVAQVEINPGRWTVIYRAQVRLTVKTADGRVLTTYDDAAMGDSRNQPALGDAHDQAMKTALSQALKRCAHNLGDQFGLSLYNDGSRNPVGIWSAAHVLPKDAGDDTLPDDEPVKPEPAPQIEQQAEQASAEGQVRRSKGAEAGPWEQKPAGQQHTERPATQQQAPASTGPSRDYLAEAERAQSREQFDRVRAAAVAEGAPQHYLAELDAIARQKEQRAQQGPASTLSATAQQAPKQPARKAAGKKTAARGRTAKAAPAPAADAAREQHAVALAELLAAGAPLGLSAEHLDDISRAEHGQTAAECTVEQLAATTADLLAATEENAA